MSLGFKYKLSVMVDLSGSTRQKNFLGYMLLLI